MPLFGMKTRELTYDPKSHPFGFIAKYTNRYVLGLRGFQAVLSRHYKKTSINKVVQMSVFASITYSANTLKASFSLNLPLINLDLSELYHKLEEMLKEKNVSFVMSNGELLCLVFSPQQIEVVIQTINDWLDYIDKRLEELVSGELNAKSKAKKEENEKEKPEEKGREEAVSEVETENPAGNTIEKEESEGSAETEEKNSEGEEEGQSEGEEAPIIGDEEIEEENVSEEEAGGSPVGAVERINKLRQQIRTLFGR